MIVGIGIGLGFQNGGRKRPPHGTLCDAIARKVCITVKDGDVLLKLAPHVVFNRGKHKIPTLDAVLVERDGKPANQANLRQFPIEALLELVVLDEGFTIHPKFDPDDPAYAGAPLCIVKPVEDA